MSHLRARSSLGLRILSTAIAGLGLVAGTAMPALAADVEAPAVRWSVTPANEDGADGRTVVENTLDPGQSVDDFFAVRNISDQTVEFMLSAADGFYTRTGRFDILPSDEESVDAGTWISLPNTVSVGGGETVVVPFRITVPEQADPGDHAAGITASILSTQAAEDGTAFEVESRVGFRVTTRVTGEIAPKAAIVGLTADYALSWNPLRPGVMTVEFDVENQGNSILRVEGAAEAGGQSTTFPPVGENPQELLTGDVRPFSVVVDDVWPLILVPTRATVTATVVTFDDEESALTPVSAEILVWAVPWPQLIVLAGTLLIVLALVWGRIRSRRRLATLLQEAKAEGRREARRGDDPAMASARVDTAGTEATRASASDSDPSTRRAGRRGNDAP